MEQQHEDAIWRWYVARTEPQREHLVASHLIARRIKTYLPEIPHRRLFGRKMRRIISPMLPGYVFVHLECGAEPWDRIRTTPGIFAHDPILGCIPLQAMQIVREKEREETEGPAPVTSPFKVGQEVVVASVVGGFATFEEFKAVVADISRLDRKGRIKVAAEWLGRLVSIEVEASKIRAA